MRRVLCISLLFIGLSVPSAWADVVVIVRRQAEAAGNYVRICDIARVEGPKEQATEVAKTVLGPTPSRGQTLEITRWDIESRLYEMGIAANVSFSGNDTVKVFGNGMAARFVDPESVSLRGLEPITDWRPGAAEPQAAARPAPVQEIRLTPPAKPETERPAGDDAPATPLEKMTPEARDMLGKAVSGYLSGLYKRPDIEIESRVLAVSEEVPYGVYEVKVVEAVSGKLPGKATLKMSVREDADAAPRIVTVSADADVYGLAPVAGRPLHKGDVLSGRDVRIQRVLMESGKAYLPPSPRAVEGRQLARNLEPGEAILGSEALPTEAVKRGDIVETVTRGSGWEVSGNAKALGGGMVGDVIKVEDTGSKTRYNARITGRGTVSVLTKSWREKN